MGIDIPTGYDVCPEINGEHNGINETNLVLRKQCVDRKCLP